MLPEKIITDTTVDLLKNNHSWIISYLLHNWFGGTYQKYLKNKILLPQMAEIDAKKELSEKYPYSDVTLVNEMKQAEIELEYINMGWVLSRLEGKISENAEWNIDPDKMKRLKDLSKEYSSEEMQEYIAKILAWEYNRSWSYSLQTLEILKSISKEELEIFQKFKSIITEWDVIFSHIFRTQEMMSKFKITYEELLLLESLNLVSWKHSKRWLPNLDNIYVYPFQYNSQLFYLKYEWKKEFEDIYLLTRTWKEIYNLLDDNYNKDYIEYLKEYFKKDGIEILTEKEINSN